MSRRLSGRAAAMFEAGVYECPDWCLQDDEEVQAQQHLGPWMPILDEGGPAGITSAYARPIRDWWDNYHGAEPVQQTATCEHYFDPSNAGVAWLTQADVVRFNAGLQWVSDWAAQPQGWVWAYPEAEQCKAEDEMREAS